jgi:hypothetical protein
VSNFLVLDDRGDRMDAMSHLTTYAFEIATPPVVYGPVGIFTANLSFRVSPDVIRIAKLELAPEFSFPKTPG